MNSLPSTPAPTPPRTRYGGVVTLRGQEYRSHAELEEALAEATYQAARDRENEPDRWPTGTTHHPAQRDAGATRWQLTRQGWEAAARLQAEGRERA